MSWPPHRLRALYLVKRPRVTGLHARAEDRLLPRPLTACGRDALTRCDWVRVMGYGLHNCIDDLEIRFVQATANTLRRVDAPAQ